MTENVVFVGGGYGSTVGLPIWVMARGIKARYVTCYMPNEHEDVKRLIGAMEKRFNITIEDIGTGETPLQLFRRQKFIANDLHDTCSRILKRDVSKKWMKDNYPNGANVYIGIGAHEIDREMSIRRNWVSNGYNVVMPLIDAKWIDNEVLGVLCERMFGFRCELYEKGFKHNNCHGACVKAGQKQWLKLYDVYPDIYYQWEETEEYVRRETGKDVAYLRKMEKGVRRPYTLRELRETRKHDDGDGSCGVCEAI